MNFYKYLNFDIENKGTGEFKPNKLHNFQCI